MPKTGATRYQKFLKSEKAKTKLKSKKDLPKGTNVTKTNFKVKKIVIKEQLKKHDDKEVLSTRKLNIKELLSRLNHFNTNARKDALEGLTEIITTHPLVLEQNLGQLILGICPMILNVEKVVRQESLKVLHLILSNLKIEKIDPFFDIMSTYLRSAMTDIDTRIQEDSLLFLDILLLCTPKNMASDFYKIIPNFLDMISKLRLDAKPGRTLTVNMGSQITTVKWRTKVLHRLQDYLKKFIVYHNIQETDSAVVKPVIAFDDTKLNYFSLCSSNFNSTCHLSLFSSKSLSDQLVNEDEKFKEYIDTLMPLLFETWLEVCPNMNTEKNIETIVNEDAAMLLNHSLEIISLLWSLIKNLNRKNPGTKIQSSFSKQYCQLYTQHFLKAFPYVTNIRSKQCNETSVENIITDPKLVEENLQICHIFILLNPQINIKMQHSEAMAVLQYIEKTFNSNTKDRVNDVIVDIFNAIFSNELCNWSKNCNVVGTLFNKIIEKYFNKDIPSSWKQKLFRILCKISLNDKLVHLHKSEAYNKWLTNLPDILLGPSITEQTVDIIHNFAVQNNVTFNNVIKWKLCNIIQNLPNIVVSNPVNDTSSYYKFYSILFWIKSWDNESLNYLENQLIENVYDNRYGKYIMDTLKLKTGSM